MIVNILANQKEQKNINFSICRKLKEDKLEEEEDLVDKEEC